ncbi:hypothetical protein PQR08_28855, partial [Caballeronia jiangsuensis]
SDIHQLPADLTVPRVQLSFSSSSPVKGGREEIVRSGRSLAKGPNDDTFKTSAPSRRAML